MGGKSAPPTPDYAAAAAEQARSSREVTEQQTWANRPTQITPFGTQSWSNTPEWDPTTGQYLNKWTQTTSLTPDLQQAADAQGRVTNQRSQLASDLTGRLQSEMGSPMDWSNLPETGGAVAAPEYGDLNAFRQKQEDNLYSRATSRLDPQWQQRQDALRNQLYSAGVKEGDAGYERAMANFNRDRNDAYDQARTSAIAGGGAEMANQIGMGGQVQGQQQGASAYQTQLRQQAISEELQKRGFSLNEINAALSGQQVSTPNMPNFTPAAASQANQALTAAQLTGQGQLNAFNAQQAGTQGLLSGLTSAGLAGVMLG